MTALRRVLTAFVLVLTASLAHTQAYTSIVVIGDSLSDTGNDTKVSTSIYGPAAALPAPVTGYTNGSFTDGIDTLPPATLYNGVWIKQLAATLAAKPAVIDSLDGGTNYAYGFAFTGSGTTPFTYGPNNALSFPVNNMGLQLSTYLATSPVITSKTLFVIWGGANDLLNATSPAAITTAVTNEIGIVSALVNAGATDFLVVNLPPLGAIPRLKGTGLQATVTATAAAFNQGLAGGLAQIPAAFPTKTLHLYQLDVFTLFNTIIANPSTYGFTNVTDMSQAAAVNPDKYLFWDGLHPTTAGHHQLALAAAALIAPGATSTSITTNSPASNLGAQVTFVATVNSSFGTPTGVVTFSDGSTAIGTAQLVGNTATFTTSSLTAGTHSISATYGATQYFTASTSNPVSEVVTAPALVASINPTALTITSGATGTATLSVATIGGYTGPVTLSCGSLPDQISCSFSPSTLTFLGANNTLTSTLTVNTGAGLKSSLTPARPMSSSSIFQTIATCSLLPLFGLLAFRRKSLRNLPLLVLFLLLSSGALLGLSGCGSGANSANAHTGLYTIQVQLAAGSNASNSLSFVVTVN
jgi:phospholipase/lecithinase/hemolysin